MKDVIKSALPEAVRWSLRRRLGQLRSLGKPKIFGIGNNKTGTTSLKVAMKDLGYLVGSQRHAENLLSEWSKRDFKKIVEYCRSAEFFQDIPFSKPYTFVALDYEFPKSKFILTVRDSPEQWYNSLVSFHSKIWGKDGRVPTKEDLQNATYIYKGQPWEANRMTSTTPEDDIYNKEILLNKYISYNESVIEYFRHRPNDLLVLNVSEKDAYKKLCDFIGKETTRRDFPWENKTKEVSK
tara:strand:+ start:731 stop:1444 length:714 start_codon:yes stop_codon:yes gene_type:complete